MGRKYSQNDHSSEEKILCEQVAITFWFLEMNTRKIYINIIKCHQIDK